jgi:2-polyprenyl-3-methyl-5-hydroxy-6-metoxy-1,4-benzoquinol methylase
VDVSQCEGFDVDEKGINTLRAAMPSETFHCVDISRDLSEVFRGRYDLVIAGEVLEHVPNAGHFLAGCRALLAPEGKLCVTVPNAVAPKNGARAAGGYEVTHPDHFVYYSPRTVARTLRAAGFVPTAITTYFADADPSGRIFNAAVRAIQRLRRGPVGDGVIALATPKIGDDIDG